MANRNNVIRVNYNVDNFDYVFTQDRMVDAVEGPMTEHNKATLLRYEIERKQNRCFEARMKSKAAADNGQKIKKRKRRERRRTIGTVLSPILLAAVLAGASFLRLSSEINISESDKKIVDDKISLSEVDARKFISYNLSTPGYGDGLKEGLIEAANISDLEMRCYVLGALRAIGKNNTLFHRNFDPIFDELFGSFNEFPGASKLLFAGSVDNYLKALGYTGDATELFEKYWEYERENIYRLLKESGLSDEQATNAINEFDKSVADSQVKQLFGSGNITYDNSIIGDSAPNKGGR